MSKQRFLAVTVILAALLVAAPATAKDLNGRFGVGAGTTLQGNPGLSFKYFVGHLGVNLMTSYTRLSTEQVVGEQTGDHVQQEYGGALRVLFNAARAKDTNLYLGAGFDFASISDKQATGDETSWKEIGFELVMGAEHFFGNHFALYFETGAPIRLASDDAGSAIGRISGGNNMLGGKGSSFQLGAMAPHLASGFAFYF